NGDATHHFKQNSDLFWLSGIDQEESILVISPEINLILKSSKSDFQYSFGPLTIKTESVFSFDFSYN
ncbi:MAG: hypothetical protein EBU01_09405, partial [Crocinitomicaceae bacterium]|nr:hypothetical protein [Crocinitomicaceae bacterium]